jgi:hypothetical protein
LPSREYGIAGGGNELTKIRIDLLIKAKTELGTNAVAIRKLDYEPFRRSLTWQKDTQG